MKKCPKCKKSIEVNAKECTYCGKSFKVPKWAIAIFILALIIVPIIVVQLNGNKAINTIVDKMNVSKEQAEDIYSIFKEVGLNNFISIKHEEVFDNDNGEGSKFYRLSYEQGIENIIIILDSDKKVMSIEFVSGDYLYKDNKVLSNIADYEVSFNEKAELKTFAENKIKDMLKSPSSAKFASSSEWEYSKANKKITVKSYVESENSFGSMVKSEFELNFDENKNLIRVVLDGKEYK